MAGSIKEDVSQLITEMFADIKHNAQATEHYDTGKTVESLEQRYREDGGVMTFEVWANKYFGTLDTGSAPARRRGSDAEREEFIRQLAGWCQRKGFPQAGMTPEQYTRAAKWLKWYIGKFGSYVYRHPAEQGKVIAPAVARFEGRLEQRLTAFYEAEITNTFTSRQ